MTRHPLDTTALIFGLLFVLAAAAILIDETLPSVDAAAVTGAIVGALGVTFVVTLIGRQLRAGSSSPPAMTEPMSVYGAEPTTNDGEED